ncbi:MAG: hypothetical protein JW882_05020 [Deltaproteobacteria bacterium]|nr:hypothetical protein [Deltaproteobacteria bacterium]
MDKKTKIIASVFSVLVLSILFSCSTVPEIRITYRVPAITDDLSNKSFSLDFYDARASKNVIGENARGEYKGFPDNFTMFLSDNTDRNVRAGIFNIRDLFLKAIKMRLENQGMAVTEEDSMKGNRMIIVLKEFSLDLVERKWVVKISYEARMEINETERAKQTISAQGERLKVLDHKQADILLSEIFTDSINRLNSANLLSDANIN